MWNKGNLRDDFYLRENQKILVMPYYDFIPNHSVLRICSKQWLLAVIGAFQSMGWQRTMCTTGFSLQLFNISLLHNFLTVKRVSPGLFHFNVNIWLLLNSVGLFCAPRQLYWLFHVDCVRQHVPGWPREKGNSKLLFVIIKSLSKNICENF